LHVLKLLKDNLATLGIPDNQMYRFCTKTRATIFFIVFKPATMFL